MASSQISARGNSIRLAYTPGRWRLLLTLLLPLPAPKMGWNLTPGVCFMASVLWASEQPLVEMAIVSTYLAESNTPTANLVLVMQVWALLVCHLLPGVSKGKFYRVVDALATGGGAATVASSSPAGFTLRKLSEWPITLRRLKDMEPASTRL
jgi:hypothetical protein